MSTYTPETPFETTSNLIYNLRQQGFRKGKPIMVNDVAISVQAAGLESEQQDEIMKVIQDALNEKFPAIED